MKQSILVTCLTLMFLVSIGMGYAQDEGSLVGFWRFDEGQGDVAEDTSVNGLNGELLGGPSWVDGKVLTGLQFDGGDDYVEMADMVTPSLLTFACWFNWMGSGSGGVPRLHTSGGGPWALEFGIGNTHQPDQLGFYLAFTDGSTIGWKMIFAPEQNTWYHTAITYDGEWIRIYIDGDEVHATDEAPGKEINQTMSRIGGGAAADFFEGIIDEVLMFDTALPQPEIVSIMSGQWLAVDPLDKVAATWGSIKVSDQ